MKPLLEQEGLSSLKAFLQRDTLIAFDYDGTLAPIVSDRDRAPMRATTRSLLGKVARCRPTIVLTGRARSDALKFLTGIELLEVIGNHGLEADGAAAGRFVRLVSDWRDDLSERLEALEGVEVEDKRYTLSVHFRKAPDKVHARDVVARAVSGLESVRVVGGKDVINCVPAGASHKGAALRSVLARHNISRAVFSGDDDTDEDVFRMRDAETLLTVRVAPDPASAAMFYLRTQLDIDALLNALLTNES